MGQRERGGLDCFLPSFGDGKTASKAVLRSTRVGFCLGAWFGSLAAIPTLSFVLVCLLFGSLPDGSSWIRESVDSPNPLDDTYCMHACSQPLGGLPLSLSLNLFLPPSLSSRTGVMVTSRLCHCVALSRLPLLVLLLRLTVTGSYH